MGSREREFSAVLLRIIIVIIDAWWLKTVDPLSTIFQDPHVTAHDLHMTHGAGRSFQGFRSREVQIVSCAGHDAVFSLCCP